MPSMNFAAHLAGKLFQVRSAFGCAALLSAWPSANAADAAMDAIIARDAAVFNNFIMSSQTFSVYFQRFNTFPQILFFEVRMTNRDHQVKNGIFGIFEISI